MKDLHLHIWPTEEVMASDDYNKAGCPPDECVDLKHVDTYPNMVNQDPESIAKYGNDGYYQYSGDMSDGRSIEVRIPLDITLD